MKLRFSYQPYLDKIDRYYERLFAEFRDMQIADGGPIILMQVENEYGGYANDKAYLHALAELMTSMALMFRWLLRTVPGTIFWTMDPFRRPLCRRSIADPILRNSLPVLSASMGKTGPSW